MKRIKQNSGAAMVVALIVGAVILVFCLSLLLVSYTLFTQTNRQITQEQCRILTQSTMETLGKELKNPDSELALYLGEQIKSGKWMSESDSNAADPDAIESDVVSELSMTVDSNDQTGDYHIQVTFTYEYNLPDDDDDEGGGGKDDQDDQDLGSESGKSQQTQTNNSSTSEPGQPAGNGSYTVWATVKCMRGSESDRDVQFYEMKSEFAAVTLKGADANEE